MGFFHFFPFLFWGGELTALPSEKKKGDLFLPLLLLLLLLLLFFACLFVFCSVVVVFNNYGRLCLLSV